jgi:hypothetical protein
MNPNNIPSTILIGEDGRFRASGRVLIAGIVLIQLTVLFTTIMQPLLGITNNWWTMPAVGSLQALAFAVLLVGWSRFVDKRPISDYGFSVSKTWFVELIVGFSAVFIAYSLWVGAGIWMGWIEADIVLSSPNIPIAIGFASMFVAIATNVWVQDTIFFGLVIKNASEGLHARGITAKRATLAAGAVAMILFVLIHDRKAPKALLDLAIAGGIFSLLYIHTKSLALTLGAHLGANFVGGYIYAPSPQVGEHFAAILVTENAPVSIISNVGFPKLAIAYTIALLWIRWHQKENFPIKEKLATWSNE